MSQFIAYTDCETGFRHFSDIAAVDVSFDRRFIAYIIDQKNLQLKSLKEQRDGVRQQAEQAREQRMLPPIIDAILEAHGREVNEYEKFAKRMATAECVLNTQLVREVRWLETIEEAIAYTVGTL